MRFFRQFLQHQGKRLLALLIVLGLFWFTRLPALSMTERSTLASQFHFTQLPLPEVSGPPPRTIRAVHPSLEQHAGWISAVGAAVALNDLDGDGLPNDVCYVETRTDQVIVAPVPGTEPRYAPFDLVPNSLPYDAATMAPMGCLPGDLNEDGHMDLLVYYWGRTPIAFLYQSSDQAVPVSLALNSYVQQEIDTNGDRWYTNAATFADLDGDGHHDLIIGNYFQDGAQILNAKATGVEAMQHSMTRAYNGGKNRILRWSAATTGANPTIQFQEAQGVLDHNLAHAWTLAVGTADLDGDLLPEIYFANDFGPDRLLHNRSQPGQLQFALLEGQKTLTTPNSKVLGRDSFKGMGVDFGDINHDGLLDIYVSNIADQYALEESHFLFTSTGQLDQMNQGIAPYVDRSEPLGISRSSWSWETKFGDFNNDGELEALQATGFAQGRVNRWPELHELAMGNDDLLSHAGLWPRFHLGDDLSGHDHNPFFVRAADGRYYDLAPDLDLDVPDVTRGIATADVDGDGDLDFAVANQWDTSQFYQNINSQAGAFLGLHLLLPPQSETWVTTQTQTGHPQAGLLARPAIGASVRVHLPNGQVQVAQVDGGNGHSGARSPELHFGLGQVANNLSLPVELQWRDSGGKVHQESLLLEPGWHTVLLGNTAKSLSKSH